jgi:ABC-type sugar transport system ATPase subunit
MSTIDIRKATKKFGAFVAVRDVDLSVAAGEVVCLLGPSGCGKTTTLRMIAGLERATAGDIVIAGRRMNELPPEKRDIAMVFQFYALYPALTIGQNIAMPLHYERLGSAEIASRVNRVAGILHLGEVLDRLPGQVSEGE